jgi:pyrimidine oxygenase
MTRGVDFGVFLPVTNNGWIISKTSPQFLPTFALNRAISLLAERIGFGYVFSMAKWRGFGGATDFWKYSLESLTLMAALAPVTSRLRLIASVAPALIHPAVFAKMAATLDDVAGGRLGINIVSAGNRDEYAQMGLYPEHFEAYRYDYTEEWLTVVKRLWTEDRVSFRGRWFTLEECESWPKPLQGTVPLVCATSSERGFQFIAAHCTDGFFGGVSLEQKKATSRRIKEIARAHGRAVRTHTLVMLIQGDSDRDAERRLAHYQAGADVEAIANVYRLRARDKTDEQAASYRERFESGTRLFYGGVPFVGGPERVAAMIEELAVDGEVDGVMFVFPDFLEGLQRFSEQVMPLLRQRGLQLGGAFGGLASA